MRMTGMRGLNYIFSGDFHVFVMFLSRVFERFLGAVLAVLTENPSQVAEAESNIRAGVEEKIMDSMICWTELCL